jgi:hypothetical protein
MNDCAVDKLHGHDSDDEDNLGEETKNGGPSPAIISRVPSDGVIIAMGDGGGLGESGKSDILWGHHHSISGSMLALPEDFEEAFNGDTMVENTDHQRCVSGGHDGSQQLQQQAVTVTAVDANDHEQRAGLVLMAAQGHRPLVAFRPDPVTETNTTKLAANTVINTASIETTTAVTTRKHANTSSDESQESAAATVPAPLPVEDVKKFERTHWKIVPATRKSNVLLWKYFKVYDESHRCSDTIVCALCYEKKRNALKSFPKQWEVKIGDSKSTSHLLLHLKHNHKAEYEEYMQADREKKILQGKLVAVPFSVSDRPLQQPQLQQKLWQQPPSPPTSSSSSSSSFQASSGDVATTCLFCPDTATVTNSTNSTLKNSNFNNNNEGDYHNASTCQHISSSDNNSGCRSNNVAGGEQLDNQDVVYVLTSQAQPNQEEKYMKSYLRLVIQEQLPLDLCNRPLYQSMLKTLSRRNVRIEPTTLFNLLDAEVRVATDYLREDFATNYISLSIDRFYGKYCLSLLPAAVFVVATSGLICSVYCSRCKVDSPSRHCCEHHYE